ncbi:MAG: hypothetical protein AB7T38_06830 [Nitrospirales bacterium]
MAVDEQSTSDRKTNPVEELSRPSHTLLADFLCAAYHVLQRSGETLSSPTSAAIPESCDVDTSGNIAGHPAIEREPSLREGRVGDPLS